MGKPLETKVNTLLTYYQTKKYIEAEKLAKLIIFEFPENIFAWRVLSFVLKKNGKLNESLSAHQKSVQLDPNNEETHFNLGNTLRELGKLEEAKESYKQAIRIKPDYVDAYNNLGITFQQLGELKEAKESYKQVIRIKPDYVDAYNNLGYTFQKLGELEEAANSFTRAIGLNPNLSKSHLNLVKLLTIYDPKKKISNEIVKINQEIKNNYLKNGISEVKNDDKIIKLIHKSSSIIKRFKIELVTERVQVFRNNSVDLNCDRHKAIFNKFNIIPKFCFGCYKIQIEPKSIIDLIKLLVIFDKIKLDNNNIRKCIVEMRPNISGFYKGLIYCSGLEEANQVSNFLKRVVNENISSELFVTIKRGCSEYPISYPDYKKINNFGEQPMNYNEDWKSIEEKYDTLNSIKSNMIIPTVSGLNLHDILIIQNWIDYAKAIGDSSVNLLNQTKIFSLKIYNIAKKRTERYPWRE